MTLFLSSTTIGLLAALAALSVGFAFLYLGRPFLAWVLPGAGLLSLWTWVGDPHGGAFWILAGLFALLAALFGIPPLRRNLVTRFLMPRVRAVLPDLGPTEKQALEAGTVWWEGELFSGRPDWSQLLETPSGELSQVEREFLQGPVEELCAAVDSWDVMQRGDLPEAAWKLIREHRFWGMIIPEEDGGLGFSAAAHSAVIARLATRSVTLAVTVMVPNSLGPAELLLDYGTEEQRSWFLPRLARGEEIPCFALTGPEAGSDAAATQSVGIVQRGEYRGEEVLGMRLSWKKRYITLGPISTIIGLAFRLRDPDGLLGDQEELGITCALIPSDLEGIRIGERHDPLGIPFHNGPNEGEDVFVPLDAIIGGPARAGEGWKMLMQSLAAGRSISMPSLAAGSCQLAARVVSAYAMVREQFDTPIGRFEGVEEPLSRIAASTWLANGALRTTLGALDQGAEPAVVGGIMKCYLTEAMRDVVADAMDVRAGAGIIRGPRNVLAPAHMAVPIGITVEGANILTRSMIIYGQGAIRCHPYVLDEIHALEEGDLAAFDRAFFRHAGHPFVAAARALGMGLFGRLIAGAPGTGEARRAFASTARLSAAFALTSEAALLTLGGGLKRRERISGRLADALAWLYLGSTALKSHLDDGSPEGDRPFARWIHRRSTERIEEALLAVLGNLPVPLVGRILRRTIFPFGAPRRVVDDELVSNVARSFLDDPETRSRLTSEVYLPPSDEKGLGRLEAALDKARGALEVEARLREAVRSGRLGKCPGDDLAERALQADIIDQEDRKRLREADEARWEAIQVDAFSRQEFEAMHR